MLNNTTTGFDAVGFIMDFENDKLSNEAIIDGFQEMINSGLVWQLQGCYSGLATRLIASGKCQPRVRA